MSKLPEIKAVCFDCQRDGYYESIERQQCIYCGSDDLKEVKTANKPPKLEGSGAPRTFTQDHLNVSVKLEYLDRLIQLENGDIPERIVRVLDSIEKDLGIGSFNVGDLTVKLSVDTSEFAEKMKNVENIVQKVRHQVAGMYKREWTE